MSPTLHMKGCYYCGTGGDRDNPLHPPKPPVAVVCCNGCRERWYSPEAIVDHNWDPPTLPTIPNWGTTE